MSRNLDDCLEIWDQALEDPKGIRIKFDNEGDATQFRLRLHKARMADRDSNRDIYKPGDALWKKSVYDGMVVRLRQDGEDWYVYVQKINRGAPEPLSEVSEEEPQVATIARRV